MLCGRGCEKCARYYHLTVLLLDDVISWPNCMSFMEHSKTKTSFYPRIYVTWLISQGINTVPKIIAATGMPRRIAQDTLEAIYELAIELDNNNGTFAVLAWGAVSQDLRLLISV